MADLEQINNTVRIFDAMSGMVGEKSLLRRADEVWRELLTPEEFRVVRQKVTETKFKGRYNCYFEEGLYKCVGCGIDLFSSSDKYDSGKGWPSFSEPVSELNVRYSKEEAAGLVRDEVLCSLCGAHLGHVFHDGPPPSKNRYSINGTALRFVRLQRP